MEINLKSIYRSYDIRGEYPEQINDEVAYKIAQAYVQYVKPDGKIAVGMDARTTSPELHESVINGLIDAGIDVVDIGPVSTDMYYFAVGYYKLAGGIQVTASHQPAQFNGMKMIRENAYPLYGEAGIQQIRDIVEAGEWEVSSDKKGTIEKKDIWSDFADYALGFIKTDAIKPLKVVINPNFGYQGNIFKYIVKHANLPIEIVGINDEPDGSFPKGQPDPSLPENRPEFIALVKSSGADLGITWDADGDRVFFCTGSGRFVDPYYTNALLYANTLIKNPGATVLYEPRFTWALIDTAKEYGGTAVLERVGHSYIKARMKKEDAVISGESSGHTYFRDFWYADSGIIPSLIIMETVCVAGKSLDELLEPLFNKYFISGEINSTVSDHKSMMATIRDKYQAEGAEISEFDGVSVEYPDWRANVRPSANDPVLRLCVEAKSEQLMEEKRDELLAIIRA
ncbi:MAG: phosphomannomutase/phosphoglucomutase [Patescibacteria group bacterium]|jgi:phosphomannomutase